MRDATSHADPSTAPGGREEKYRVPGYWRSCMRGEMFAAIVDKMHWVLETQIQPLEDPAARRVALEVFREFSFHVDLHDLRKASELLADLRK